MSYVFEAIKRERVEQDRQWGGPEHDDEHDEQDWSDFIVHQACAIDFGRERLVKIAALAVAAIESIDRKSEVNP
jgi:hypothetical protein